MIDSQQAGEALSDIDVIVRRVRQSQICRLAGVIMIMWGVLVFAGYVATYLSPPDGNAIWIVTDLIGIAGTVAVGVTNNIGPGARAFAIRMLIALLLFCGFGFFSSMVLGHFAWREMIVFWTFYAMLFYALAGLWFGYAFIVIAVCACALTLIGYYDFGEAFILWMAVAQGSALTLGGLWVRRS